MKRRRGRAKHVFHIDADPRNENWLRMVQRDVDSKGEPVKTRFDIEAEARGEKFETLEDQGLVGGSDTSAP